MKNKRNKKFGAAFGEAIAEIILTLLAAAIGFGIFKLFGVSDDFIGRNSDLIILVGLFIPALALAALIVILMKIFGEKKPKKKEKTLDIILDTDVGSDCDDMMALAYLVYAKRNLSLDIKAITHSNSCPEGIPAMRAFFGHLDEAAPPIGKPECDIEYHDKYAKAVTEKFADEECYAAADSAVSVMRRALLESTDAVILGIGPMTNIAALLDSAPDEISTLDGISLVRERCRKIVLMAGDFTSGKPEWNVKLDIPAMQTVVNKSPAPIAFLPFEVGYGMITGKPIMDAFGEDNPLSLSFMRFPGTDKLCGRHSWDPAAAVYAVLGDSEYLTESEPQRVTVTDEGVTVAAPERGGMHTVISLRMSEGESEADAKARVAAYIDGCAVEIYNKQSNK